MDSNKLEEYADFIRKKVKEIKNEVEKITKKNDIKKQKN